MVMVAKKYFLCRIGGNKKLDFLDSGYVVLPGL